MDAQHTSLDPTARGGADPNQPSPATARRLEQESLVEAWRSSGLSQAAFARAQGVPVHRLRYWVRRAGHSSVGEVATQSAGGFVEYPVEALAQTRPGRHVLRFRTADGAEIALEFGHGVSAAFVGAVFQAAVP